VTSEIRFPFVRNLANCEMAQVTALLGWSTFLYSDTIDLVVIGDRRFEFSPAFWTTDARP